MKTILIFGTLWLVGTIVLFALGIVPDSHFYVINFVGFFAGIIAGTINSRI